MLTPDLFTPLPTSEARHEPGGKVKTPLPAHVRGHAAFCGPKHEYRLWLSRLWGEPSHPSEWALLIGMNPSTATAAYNDPTITREIDFVQSWGLRGFYKCNICDYRSTSPKGLSAPGVVPCSELNLPTIKKLAAQAERIVVCWGKLQSKLQEHAQAVLDLLQHEGHELLCFGHTKHGHPCHPLYLPKHRQLERF